MAADEPPYLTVGTDVSAKYKGAFCEAKIKKVSKVVKCKLTFKNNVGCLMLPDDQIRGMLRVGAVVEARHPEKNQFMEAVINKMQDCSQYTVVFDDGDETTLRRTSLCLKSGRHFAESPTLDQFPLTNPEHFGTPVIGTSKTKRKRRSTLNSAALGYYSSDEELTPKKVKSVRSKERDPDVGKVMCVDYGDRRKKDSWYPGLVVLANASQDTIKINTKEEYLIRSFKDGKYYQVPKRDAREFTREACRRIESNTLKTAVEKALLYYEKGELPPHWDKVLHLGMELASADEESHDTDSDTSDDEPSEEKDRFVAQLYKFMDERGTPINKAPTVGSRDLNLYKLFKVVHKMGGYNRVTNQNKWKIIYSKMGLPSSNLAGSNQIKLAYKRYLHSFEDFYRKLGCTMVSNSRSTRGRHRSDRNIIITRNRDRDSTASPKAKASSREPKDKGTDKKPEEKPKETDKQQSKTKSEASPKSDEKIKKKIDKTKADEKEQKGKQKKEDVRPRLARSQSLNKDKRENVVEEKKETRTVRARTREEQKKEKSESPEKKETRSSAKFEQEREKREKELCDKKMASESKESKDRPLKEKKDEKAPKECSEEKLNKRNEGTAKDKKVERSIREKTSKEEKVKPQNEERSPKEKKDNAEDVSEKKLKQPDAEAEKHESKPIIRERKERMKVEVLVTRIKDEKLIKGESEISCVKEAEVKSVKKEVLDLKALPEDECPLIVDAVKEEDEPKKLERDSDDANSPLPPTDLNKEEKTSESDGEMEVDMRGSPPGISQIDDDDDELLSRTGMRKRHLGDEKDDKAVIDLSDSDDDDYGSSSERDGKERVIEVGDRVRVKYGRGRTQKVYEAKVLKTEISGGEKRYYVHYAGWNMRYDEWVKRNFIVENISDKHRSARQQKQALIAKATLSSPMVLLKKSDRSRLPYMSPVVKLSRKNSTSSTTSVSSSRTTRSDKNSLQSSPFSRGLQPKRRTRKKSGVSVALTDTSQDSESDEDDLLLLDPADDEDNELESDSLMNAKDKELFSDDDLERDDLEISEKIEKSFEKELSAVEVKAEYKIIPKTVSLSIVATDVMKAMKLESREDSPIVSLIQDSSSIKYSLETKGSCRISSDESVKSSSNNNNSPLPSSKPDDSMPSKQSLNASTANSIVFSSTLKNDDSVILKSHENVKSDTSDDSEAPAPQLPSLTGYSTDDAKGNSNSSTNANFSFSLAKIDKPAPLLNLHEAADEFKDHEMKSVRELIETKYVDKSESGHVNLNLKDSKQAIDEKMPPLITYMGSCTKVESISDVGLQASSKETLPKSIGPFSRIEQKFEAKALKSNENEAFRVFDLDVQDNNAQSDFGFDLKKEVPKMQPINSDSSQSSLLSSVKKCVSSDYKACKDTPYTFWQDSPGISSAPVRNESLFLGGWLPSAAKQDSADSFKLYSEVKNVKKSIQVEKVHESPSSSSSSTEMLIQDTFSVDDPESPGESKVEFHLQSSSLGAQETEEKLDSCSEPPKMLEGGKNEENIKVVSKNEDEKLKTNLPSFLPARKSFGEISSSRNNPENLFPLIREPVHDMKPMVKLVPPSNLVQLNPVRQSVGQVISIPEMKDAGLHTSVITFAASAALSLPLISNTISTDDQRQKLKGSLSTEKDQNTGLPRALDLPNPFVSKGKKPDVEKLDMLGNIRLSAGSENKERICPRILETDADIDDCIHESLTELSIDDKLKEDSEDTFSEKSGTDNCASTFSDLKDNIFSSITAEKPKEIASEIFPGTSGSDNSFVGKDEKNSLKLMESDTTSQTLYESPVTERKTLSDKASSNEYGGESDSCFSAPVSKKETKKKKCKTSKQDKKIGSIDSFGKDGKYKSKKKRTDGDDFAKSKDSELKPKSKKMRKSKSKKHLSKYDDPNADMLSKGDLSDEGTRDVTEKIKRKEKRRRDEKKFSKFDLKSEEALENKGESAKKEKKKGRKNKAGGDKKSDFGDKKVKKKKKIHTDDNIDSDSEKDSLIKLNEKKKKKEKKKIKLKDSSSSDEPTEAKLMSNDDPDISFLLCEEKVPASPVNNLPDDTTSSSSMEDNNRLNRSPVPAEEPVPVVNLNAYSRSAAMDVLDVNKHNPEACAVLDNTPPTTPSSTESIPSSSPSHDREPFLHYTESTQSGRDSGGESDSFPCESNRTVSESEEYRAAATLAFAVCKSVSGKMADSSRVPIKRQKSENEDYSPSKRKKRNKRSYGVDPNRTGHPRVRGFSPRYSKGESCDAFDSSGASPIAVGSPTRGSTSSLYASFSHATAQQICVTSDGPTGGATKSNKISFCVPLNECKDPEKRIAILQEKMSELRKLYASLKAEVATIDRRRKKARKKTREAAGMSNNSSTYSEEGQNCS